MKIELAPADAISLRVGSETMAHAASCEVLASRACCAVEAYGEPLPLALIPGTIRYTLQLREILWENAIDYYTMSNFSVEITENGHTVQFGGCQWTAVEESPEGGFLWRRATLQALTRTEADHEES